MLELLLPITIIVLLYLYLNDYLFIKNEGLCMNPIKCGSTELEHVLKYDWETEPNNPFYTNNMVVPKLPDAYSGENIKSNYLHNANNIYSDIENDLLNAALVPKHGMTFVYP